MFITRINLSILLFIIPVVSGQSYLRDLLLFEIPKSCKSAYQVQKDVQHFQICFGEVTRRVMNIEPDPNLDAAVNDICQSDLSRCFKTLGNDVNDCLTEETYAGIFDDPIRAIRDGQKYACSNNGQPLKDFIIRSPFCPFHIVGGLKSDKCKNQTIREDLFTQSFSSKESCRDRVDWIICWVNAYDQCNDPVARDFVKTLGLKMLVNTGCKKYTWGLKPELENLLLQTPTPTTQMLLNISSTLLVNLLQLPITFLSILYFYALF